MTRNLLPLVLAAAFIPSCAAPNEVATSEAAALSHWGHTISFMFDDGYAGVLDARTVLSSHGFNRATAYIITDEVGQTTPLPRMDWPDIASLALGGWEVGSHTVHHQDLAASSPWNIPPGSASPNCADHVTRTMQSELLCSREALRSYGFSPFGFAFPHGVYDADSMRIASSYYVYARSFWDPSDARSSDYNPAERWCNDFPYNRQAIRVIRVYYCDTVDSVWARICQAFYGNGNTTCAGPRPSGDRWVPLVFHDIYPQGTTPAGCTTTALSQPGLDNNCGCPGSPDHAYSWRTDQLDQLAGRIQNLMTANPGMYDVAAAIDVFGTPSSGTAFTQRGVEQNTQPQMDFATSSYSPYVAGPGTTLSRDTAHGVFPTQTSIRIQNDPSAVRYLHSQYITVTPGTYYIAEATIDVGSLTSGVAGFYVDEYSDPYGTNWSSGWDICPAGGCVTNTSIVTYNHVYWPSPGAHSVRLQVYLNYGNSPIFVDNVSLRQL